MKKEEIINNGYYTRHEDHRINDMYDLLVLDIASLDDGGWQVREAYIGLSDKDDYILLSHGDGYNGYNIGDYMHKPANKQGVARHLGVTEDDLDNLTEDIIYKYNIHLNSTDWDMLEELQELQEEEEEAAE